jgi:hypothetical protein
VYAGPLRSGRSASSGPLVTLRVIMRSRRVIKQSDSPHGQVHRPGAGGVDEHPLQLLRDPLGGDDPDLIGHRDQGLVGLGFDLQADRLEKITLRQSKQERIKLVGFHSDPRYLVVAYESGQLQCWDFAALLLTGLASRDGELLSSIQN